MRRAACSSFALLSLLAALALALGLPAAARAAGERTYIVMTRDGVRPRAALSQVNGTPDVVYAYGNAFDGFAARLTARQRAQLARSPQVVRVFRNHKRALQSVASDNGLPAALWDQLGGAANAGEGVVVGVLDSGITPEHPSFAGDGYGPPPPGWRGACEPGFCNSKIIGARSYLDGFGRDHLAPGSFASARDDAGHGTHVASVAAGDFGVDPVIDGNDLGVDRIAGVAPRARIAAYKICWVGGDVDDGCTDADTVKAIDDAVADGVDVINYSVGSEGSDVVDAVSYAFLGATEAGVFVATAAGNDGPGAGTVAAPSTVPWVTSVAADGPARTFTATATIDGPRDLTVTGGSVTTALTDPAPVGDGGLCGPELTGAGGAVVVCRRGENDRVEKSRNVRDAGGAGMILANAADDEDIATDTHYVPSLHVSRADGDRILADLPATATITRGTAAPNPARGVAAFSSRGPQTAVPDLLKPDLAAPGVSILGANSPDPASNLRPGTLFQAISGTSMATPYVAGAAALLRQRHPDWSPAEIKSALMMTARGVGGATPFDAGSGEVDPAAASAAGLVLDERPGRYRDYLDGAVAPSDLNLPSIASGAVAGAFATSRTFTATRAGRWTAHAVVPGFDVAISDASFAARPGRPVRVRLRATRTTAALDRWALGDLTLARAGEVLHVPIALRPVALGADDPIEVGTRTSSGAFDIGVQAGFTGTLRARGFGLTTPDVRAGYEIGRSPTGTASPDPGPGNAVTGVTVPAGTRLLAARLGNASAGSDLDLYLYRGRELVATSASEGSDEAIDALSPAPGDYRFVVVGFTTADPASTYDLSTYLVGGDQRGFAVTGGPVRAGVGDGLTFTGVYSGADAPGLYLGVADFGVARRVVELTRVPGPPPARPRLRVLGARLVGPRVLRLRVRLNRRARVGLRAGRARAGARVVRGGTHRVRYRLSRRLRPGRHVLRLRMEAGGQRARAVVRIRVRR